MLVQHILLLALPLVTLAVSTAITSCGNTATGYFFKGHDLSSLKLLEDGGALYKDTSRNNETRPAEDILGDGGMNSVRLRIWVNPSDGVYGLPYTLKLARRFHGEGYKIYLDFHFADTWADPGHQPIPSAWPTTLGPLAKTLRFYVKDTLIAFKKAGVDLAIVALGNEIRYGMLWPVGKVDLGIEPTPALVANFSNLATLYKSARAGVDDAVHAGVKMPEILIHIDNGWDLALQQRWFGAFIASGVKTSEWTTFGFSFYPFYDTSATFANLKNSLDTLAEQFRKPLQIVETDYAAICNGQYNTIPTSPEPEIPYDIQGQKTWVNDIIAIVKAVPYGLGRGVHYWEPAWLNFSSLGTACNDAILFTADNNAFPNIVGYSRSSVDMFRGHVRGT